MGVVFTSEAAQRIIGAVRKVERNPQNRTGERNPAGPNENDFWAMLSGCDPLTGQRYSFIRIIPDASTDTPDIALDSGLKFRLPSEDPLHFQVAYEVNGHRGIPDGTIVRVSFAGYNGDSEPVFMFQHQPQQIGGGLPIHDHRDNANGGFAFGVWHPGSGLPQQPWHP